MLGGAVHGSSNIPALRRSSSISICAISCTRAVPPFSSLAAARRYVHHAFSDVEVVVPDEVWRPSSPVAVAYTGQHLYVAATTTSAEYPYSGDGSVILKLDATGRSVLNFTIPDSNIQQMVAAARSLFVSFFNISNPAQPIQQIWQLDADLLRPVSSGLVMPFDNPLPPVLLGVDASGTVLLLGPENLTGNSTTLINASTGAVLSRYDGGDNVEVWGGGLSPLSLNVVLVDHRSRSVRLVRPNNTLVWTVPFVHEDDAFFTLAINSVSQFAYLFSQAGPPSDCYQLAQLDLKSAVFVASFCVGPYPGTLIPAENSISSGAEAGVLYFIDRGPYGVVGMTVDLLHFASLSRLDVSEHAILVGPSDVVVGQVDNEQRLFVDVNYDAIGSEGVVQMTTTGRLVGSWQTSSLPPGAGCEGAGTLLPAQTVSIRADNGDVYAPVCNGTLSVFRMAKDGQYRPLQSVNLTGYRYVVVPYGVDGQALAWVLGPVFNNEILNQYNLSTGAVTATLLPTGAQRSALSSVVVDSTDGSVWASDCAGAVWHWAPNGTVLSFWHYTDPYLQYCIMDIAVDHAHGYVLATQNLYTYDDSRVGAVVVARPADRGGTEGVRVLSGTDCQRCGGLDGRQRGVCAPAFEWQAGSFAYLVAVTSGVWRTNNGDVASFVYSIAYSTANDRVNLSPRLSLCLCHHANESQSKASHTQNSHSPHSQPTDQCFVATAAIPSTTHTSSPSAVLLVCPYPQPSSLVSLAAQRRARHTYLFRAALSIESS